MFRELFPIITTADIQRALGFYRDLLGFEVTYRFPNDRDPEYVGLRLGASHLGIGRGDRVTDAAGRSGGAGTAAAPFALWVYADDCDPAIERLREAGVTIVDEPQDQPWGERVATVVDPDGNRVIVGSRSAP